MKKNIHPKMFLVNVECICGNKMNIYSANNNTLKVDVCSHCHPTYNTGLKVEKESIGRRKKFEERMSRASAMTNK